MLKISNHPSLHEAALQNKEVPFIWLPLDMHPISKEMLHAIEEEYLATGKPLLLRRQGDGGVFPPETHWLVPEGATTPWIRKHLRKVISLAKSMPAQDITIYTNGCQGDLLASLPILRALEGGHIKVGNFEEPQWQHRNMEGERYEAIRPLLEIQPYIQSVKFEHRAAHTHDLANWRPKHRKDRTLTESQADWLGLKDVDMSPWIMNVKPSPITAGKVVVARSPRYQNPDWSMFTWPQFARDHGDKLVFIGLPEEHDAFCRVIQRQIPRLETRSLLDVAELIAGSLLFVGNQSCPCWIAMGLGHPMIQEVSPQVQDSIVRRPNARFPDYTKRTRLTPAELASL